MTKEASMAQKEPILTNPRTHEMAEHVEGYERFTKMMTWGAVACLIVAFVVVVFVL
jgi:hypothetical protein